MLLKVYLLTSSLYIQYSIIISAQQALQEQQLMEKMMGQQMPVSLLSQQKRYQPLRFRVVFVVEDCRIK